MNIMPEAGLAGQEMNSEIVKEEVACNLCGSNGRRLIARGRDREYHTSSDMFQIVACTACGHRYLNPRPVESELGRIYPSNYHAYNIRPAGSGTKKPLVTRIRHKLYQRRLRQVIDRFKGKSEIELLDVGCGDGWMLDLYKSVDPTRIRTYGVDFDPAVCKVAESFGHTVFCTRFEAYARSQRFDIVNLSHVIEHVSDPVAVCKKAFEVLRPDAILVLETPNFETWDCRISETGAWGAYHIPRHWNLSPESIRRLGEIAGFQHGEIIYNPAPVHWVWMFNNLSQDGDGAVSRLGRKLFAPLDVFKGTPKAFIMLSAGTVADLVVRALTGRTSNMMAVFEKAHR